MTAPRRTTRSAAARALRRAARAWLHAHRDAHAETAWLWRYGPGLGPTAPILAGRPRPAEGGPR